jgi:hypothetical protein
VPQANKTGPRIDVTESHYPGDSDDTMVGKNAAEFLEQTYLLFFEPEFYWSEHYLGKILQEEAGP